MKKVLIPTDFSKNSQVALDYAISLFKNSKCHFTILNTYDHLVASDHFDVAVATNVKGLQMLQSNSETGLKKIITSLEKNNGNELHEYHSISKIGTLIGAIKEIARTEKIDVIIMGTKGETSSSNLIFGSNTLQVINTRIAPVLAVPSDFKFKSLNNILFPTDLYVEFTGKHLKLLSDIAAHGGAHITILHKIFRGLNTIQRTNKNRLDDYLEHTDSSFVTIEDKEIDEAIYEYEQSHPTDMLAMINNKHSFLENLFFTPVVSKIVKNTDIPFLVIPS